MDSVKTQDSPYLAENQISHIALRRVLSRLALTSPSAPTVNSKSSLLSRSCGRVEIMNESFLQTQTSRYKSRTEGLGVLMEQPIRVVYGYLLIFFFLIALFVCLLEST